MRLLVLSAAHLFAAAAAVEPILERWRHRCSAGLIDETGKVRNVFTKAHRGAEDTVGRVIRELNQVPEARAEFENLAAKGIVDGAELRAIEDRGRGLDVASIGLGAAFVLGAGLTTAAGVFLTDWYGFGGEL